MIKRAHAGFGKSVFAFVTAATFFAWASQIPLTQAQTPAGHLTLSERDEGGIPNIQNHCPQIANAEHRDLSGDGFSNACVATDVKVPAGTIIGAHPVIGRGTVLGERIAIGDNVVLGSWVAINEGARLGSGVIVGDGSKIENDAKIGNHVILGSNVVIGSGAVVGDRCVIGRGAVVQDDASIGAGTDIAEDAYVPRGSRIAAHSVVGAVNPELGALISRAHHSRQELS